MLEKESIVRKKRETKRFFKDMEANIINKVYYRKSTGRLFVNLTKPTHLLIFLLSSYIL